MNEQEKAQYTHLLLKLKAWSSKGEEVLPAGTRRIGHASEIAPKAYTHVLFPSLRREEIPLLEKEIDRTIPKPLQEFYALHNGCGFFDGWMYIFGLRYSYDRSNVIGMLEQPHALNTFILGQSDFILGLGELPFGRVGYHDEPNYRIATISDSGTITTWLDSDASAKYQNVFHFLLEEFTVLDNACRM